MTNFRTTHPIDFNLYDKDTQNVLYIEDVSDQLLTLELKNASTQTLELADLANPVSNTNYHFALRFRPGTLSSASLGKKESSEKIDLTENSKKDWEMTLSEEGTQGDVIYLKSKTTGVVLEPNVKQILVFTNVGAARSQGARGTRVELVYKNIHFGGTPELELNSQREVHLSVINHRGKKDIPLHCGFVGDNGVLNDGNTPNSLRVRLLNTAVYNPINPDVSALIFKHDVENAKRSKIILSFHAGSIEEEAALAQADELDTVEIQQPVGWKLEESTQAKAPEWILYPDESDVVLPGKESPNGTNHLDLNISNIISNHPTGHTHLDVHYENIPGYWDGQKQLIIEKRPLIYYSRSKVFSFHAQNEGENPLGFDLGGSHPDDLHKNWHIAEKQGRNGGNCLQSGTIGDRGLKLNEHTNLFLKNIPVHKMISFWYKISPGGHCNKSFYCKQSSDIDYKPVIDDIKIVEDWTQQITSLATGIYDFMWKCEGSSFESSKNSVVWIDDIIIDDDHVGIGTANPQSKLDIKGNITVGDSYSGVVTAPENGMIVEGNVGIGTNNPQAKLEIKDGRLRISESDTNSAGVIEISNGTKTNYAFTDGGTGDLHLRTDSSDHHVLLQTGGNQGNVGIGTTNPTEKLAIAGDKSTIELGAGMEKEANAGKIAYQKWSDGLDIVGAGRYVSKRKITFYAEGGSNFKGNVGIGTTSPDEKLEVEGNIYINKENQGLIIDASNRSRVGFMKYHGKVAGIWRTNDQSFEIGRVTDTDSVKELGSAPSVDFYIKNNGNVGIGTDNPSEKLEVRGGLRLSSSTSRWTRIYTQAYSHKTQIVFQLDRGRGNAGGDIRKFMVWDGDNNIDYGSDLSLKTNIEPEKNILERLLQLEVKNYRWKGENGKDPKKIGFIAQEVQPFFPNLVGSFKDPETKETNLTLKYGGFGVLAVGAIKEQQKQIERQQQQIEALWQEIHAIRKGKTSKKK